MELKLKAGEFYGTTSQSLSARGFRFTEKAYSSRARLPKHAHELSHFCFVLAGGFASKVDVAPKVAFLPQKSFHILIAFADYDLPVAISEFVFVLAAWFYFGRCGDIDATNLAALRVSPTFLNLVYPKGETSRVWIAAISRKALPRF